MASKSGLALPTGTRMLLASDGSTTLMLEALLETRLSAIADVQHRITADALPGGVRSALRIGSSAEVVERRSRLVLPSLDAVSVNHVVLAAPDIEAVLPAPGEPLGNALLARDVPQVRRLLRVGCFATWPPNRGRCATKEYVIECGPMARIYVRELFNPTYIPVSDD